MNNIFKKANRFIFEYCPVFLKTGIIQNMPYLYPFFEIKPKSAILNITDRCNSKCIMCKQWRRSPADELSISSWKKIISDLKKNGIRNIHFTGGEPLLRNDLEELVSFSTDKKIATGITTNGLLLDDKRLERLLEAGLGSLGLSVDALGARYKEIRGIDMAFGDIKKIANLISDARKKRRLAGYINFTLMKDTIAEFRKVKELADESELPIAVCLLDKSSFIFDTEENKSKFWIDGDRPNAMLEDLIMFMKKEKIKNPSSILLDFSMFDFIKDYFRDPRQESVPCPVSQDRLIIDPSGNFLGGCMSGRNFGNLTEKSIKVAVNQKQYKEHKKNMFYKKCAGCSCGYQFTIQHTPIFVLKNMAQRAKATLFKR